MGRGGVEGDGEGAVSAMRACPREGQGGGGVRGGGRGVGEEGAVARPVTRALLH